MLSLAGIEEPLHLRKRRLLSPGFMYSPWKFAFLRQHRIDMNWRSGELRPPKVGLGVPVLTPGSCGPQGEPGSAPARGGPWRAEGLVGVPLGTDLRPLVWGGWSRICHGEQIRLAQSSGAAEMRSPGPGEGGPFLCPFPRPHPGLQPASAPRENAGLNCVLCRVPEPW